MWPRGTRQRAPIRAATARAPKRSAPRMACRALVGGRVSDPLALDRWPAEASPCRALCTSTGGVRSSQAVPSTATKARYAFRRGTARKRARGRLRLRMHPRGVGFARARRLRWLQFPWMVAGVRRDERIDCCDAPRMGVVDGDERLPTPGQRLLRKDGFHRTFRRAGAAVDALVGLNHEQPFDLIDAVDRAYLHARRVLHIETRLGDDVRHDAMLSPWRSRLMPGIARAAVRQSAVRRREARRDGRSSEAPMR